MGRLRRTLRREDGVTMITALMSSFVVFVLGTTVVSLSMHNSTQSANDRDRVQALDAAEAGIDYFFSYLQVTGGQSPACSASQSLVGSPGSFSVQANYLDAAGATIICTVGTPPTLPPGANPAYVLIKSVGTSANAAITRTMQSYVRLTVTSSSSFDNSGAIFGNTNVSFGATSQIGGSQYSDADVYANGNVTVSANSVIYGKVYAQGTVTLMSNSEVKRDVWGKLAVTLQGGARAREDVTSSTQNIVVNGGSHIYGDAKAATTITGTGIVDGYKTQNSPSGPPPTRSFPTFTFVASDWQAAPYSYTVHTYNNDCTTPLTDLASWWGTAAGTAHVVRITGTCSLTFNNSVAVKGNLAIVIDGNITLNNAARFTPGTGYPFNLFFFAGLNQLSGCGFTTKPHSGADYGLNTMIYVPAACTVSLQSNSSMTQGQVLGGNLDFKQTTSFQYSPLTVPGTGPGGFKEDIIWKREIVN